MTNLELIDDRIHSKGILLKTINTDVVTAASIKVDNQYAIFYDEDKLPTSADKFTVIAHEYYHCEYDCMYNFTDSLQTRKRREFKANYQMIQDVVPIDKLTYYIQDMHYARWELAEVFNVTEKFIDEAIRIYRSKELI